MTIIGINGNQIKLKDSSKTIVLLSKNSDISEIKSIINKKKIISFDNHSHKLLSSNNIDHEISDIYLNKNDLRLIQKLSYKFAKWHNEEQFSKIITYEDINIGLLIQVEFNYFLVQFIKKYLEILKIISCFSDSSFLVSSDLYDLVNIFTKNTVKLNDNLPNTDFYYDSVQIPIKIGNKTFRLKISKNFYTKLYSAFDKLINFSLSKKTNDTATKSTLFVEFDTIRYQSIFKNLRNVKINSFVYNRRRPSIWNFKSYCIIKNSGTKILSSSVLLDNKLKNKIENDKNIIQSLISKLFENEDSLENFFSIEDKSLWPALKSTFKNLVEKRFSESITEIQLSKKILSENQFSSILVWSEIGSTEQIMVKLAKKLGISVVVLQHGLFFDSDDEGAFDMNDFQGVFPYDADYYVVWGEIEKSHAIKFGISSEKIIPLGAPIFDELPIDTNPSDDYILLATSGPVQENAFDLTINSIEKNEKIIKEICSVANRLDKKLVIKIHPSPDEFDPTDLAKSIRSDSLVFKAGDISELIPHCSVFVVIDVSTVMLNAQLLKKPVVSIISKDSDFGFPTIITSNSCITVNIEDFENTLKKILTQKNYSESIIKEGISYANKYCVNQGSASMELLKFLRRLN